MVSAQDWSVALATQAHADITARKILIRESDLPACQQLHFLQMACEKLCKAHLCHSTAPEQLTTSHAFIAGVLPVIFKIQFSRTFKRNVKNQAQIFKRVKQLACEIELLAPAVNDNGRREDNCEYPWLDGSGRLRVPSEWNFPNLNLLHAQSGALLIKLIETAIDELRKPPPPRPNNPA